MELIETDAALAAACRVLGAATTVYLDTEFESAREGKTLSLVQAGTADRVFVVDALRLERLEPLGRVLARANVTWVFHAGLQDLELLIPRLGGRAGHLFDTQIAWALTSPEGSVSLSYLKYKLLGIRSMKTHQADDWMRRPLPREQLAYAAADIEELPAIHSKLLELLAARGREAVVEEATAEQLLPEPREEEAGELSLDSFRNAWQLDAPSQAALRALIDWVNALDAGERRFAPQPKTLLAIASRLPRTRGELARVKGVHPKWVDRHGDGVLRELRRAAGAADAGTFVPIEPAAYADFEDIRLDGWLAHMRAEVSAAAGVAPELAFNGKTLRAIRAAIVAGGSRKAGGAALTGWRRELLLTRYEAFARD